MIKALAGVNAQLNKAGSLLCIRANNQPSVQISPLSGDTLLVRVHLLFADIAFFGCGGDARVNPLLEHNRTLTRKRRKWHENDYFTMTAPQRVGGGNYIPTPQRCRSARRAPSGKTKIGTNTGARIRFADNTTRAGFVFA